MCFETSSFCSNAQDFAQIPSTTQVFPQIFQYYSTAEQFHCLYKTKANINRSSLTMSAYKIKHFFRLNFSSHPKEWYASQKENNFTLNAKASVIFPAVSRPKTEETGQVVKSGHAGAIRAEKFLFSLLFFRRKFSSPYALSPHRASPSAAGFIFQRPARSELSIHLSIHPSCPERTFQDCRTHEHEKRLS